jgi:hypothetical protein
LPCAASAVAVSPARSSWCRIVARARPRRGVERRGVQVTVRLVDQLDPAVAGLAHDRDLLLDRLLPHRPGGER